MTQAFTLHSWPHAIVHMDGDAFFASCEQCIHPELKGRPVVTGQERNIVASMSYEAKALGIQRGMRIFEARRLCPSLQVFPSDYETYSLISKRMFAVMRRFSPCVEESSIDEGYLDLDGLRRLYRTGYLQLAMRIRRTVEEELGIPVSAGLSLTKTLAKLASKHKKPRGFTAVSGREIHVFLRDIPVEKVSGIGPNTTAFLRKKGVFTALDYATRSEAWAKTTLGKTGLELWHELRGERIYPFETSPKTTAASVSKAKTFTPPSKDYDYVKAQLFRNTESAFIKLRRYHLRTRALMIHLRQQDFNSTGAEAGLSRAASSPFEVFPVIETMLRSLFRPGTLYRQTGIVLAHLEEDRGLQFELFEDPLKMIRMKKLTEALDGINAHYGKHTVGSGVGLYLKKRSARETSGDDRTDGANRNRVPRRKTELLPGETFRQRLDIPVIGIKI